jgi:uncharacterized protein YndB with AHSA1/START domain
MANAFQVSVDVAAPPDAVWAIVGDPCGVPRWYAAYVDCEVSGDRRVLRRADGAELRERLVERDDARRFYSYSVLSGVPVRDHLASFEVLATEGGSRVVWTTSGVPEDPSADLEARLAGRQAAALADLRALIEREAGGGA